MSIENLKICFDQLSSQDDSNEHIISQCEEEIDFLNLETTNYFIKLSSLLGEKSADRRARYFNYLNDIERIADHTKYLLDCEVKMKKSDN